VLEPGSKPFEDLSVQTDGMSASAQRQPVKVDSGRFLGHRRIFRDLVKTGTRGVTRVEDVVEIARSPEDVFDYCVALAHEPEWNPKARHVVKLTDGPVGLGTRFEAEFLKGRCDDHRVRALRASGGLANGGSIAPPRRQG